MSKKEKTLERKVLNELKRKFNAFVKEVAKLSEKEKIPDPHAFVLCFAFPSIREDCDFESLIYQEGDGKIVGALSTVVLHTTVTEYENRGGNVEELTDGIMRIAKELISTRRDINVHK